MTVGWGFAPSVWTELLPFNFSKQSVADSTQPPTTAGHDTSTAVGGLTNNSAGGLTNNSAGGLNASTGGMSGAGTGGSKSSQSSRKPGTI